jgi:hypothetical protein
MINIIVGEFGQYRSSNRILDSLPRFRSTTRYDDTITLTLGYIFIYTLFFLFLNFGSRSLYRSSLFRLSLRRFRLRFLDDFEDFLRIEDELPFNSYALPFLTFLTYS